MVNKNHVMYGSQIQARGLIIAKAFMGNVKRQHRDQVEEKNNSGAQLIGILV